MIKMEYIWSMPNKWTFQIKPIKKLVDEYVGDGKNWIDPFSGFNSPCEFTNDLNPESPAKFHLEAIDFVNQLEEEYNGAIFDPPYSIYQVSMAYKGFGLKFKGKENPTGGFPKVRDRISQIIKIGGFVISFGWNAVGMGKKRGFEKERILLVDHGGNRNSTICTVERKVCDEKR